MHTHRIHACMLCLPTSLPHKFSIHAGKYPSPIECLGYNSTFPVECFMGSQISAFANLFLKIRKENPGNNFTLLKVVALFFPIGAMYGIFTN